MRECRPSKGPADFYLNSSDLSSATKHPARHGRHSGPLGRRLVHDPLTGGIADANIRRSANGPQLTVWGQCSPTDCAWGTVPLTASPDGTQASAVVRTTFAIRQLQLTLSDDGNTLTITDLSHFTDNSGRRDYVHTDTLPDPLNREPQPALVQARLPLSIVARRSTTRRS